MLVEGIVQMVGTLLQSGFATWVTSELHRTASEESYRALEVQNLELSRAVAHLRELDQMKSNFLATVSHELRTPLTSVIGFTDMLLKEIAGPLNEEQRDYAATILERGEDLYALITQILDLSRIEVGELPLDIELLEIGAVVQRAVRSVALLAERAQIELRIESSPVRRVRGDAVRLHQVLVNLLSNAIKFQATPGVIRVQVSEAPRQRPCAESFFGIEADDAVRIAVTDEGPGLTQEQCSRVFDAFYQVDASSTRSHGGAGLGLSIVSKLVHAHGGDVWAESELGRGATFSFTVPLAEVVEGSPSADLDF
jgi:signal transduction histidine kinase